MGARLKCGGSLAASFLIVPVSVVNLLCFQMK